MNKAQERSTLRIHSLRSRIRRTAKRFAVRNRAARAQLAFRTRGTFFLLATLAVCSAGFLSVTIPTHAQASPAALDPFRQNAELARGVNVLWNDKIWKHQPGGFQRRYFSIIRKGGFDTVRLVLQAFDHMDQQNHLSADWLNTLDKLVSAAQASNLNVILDEHDYDLCGVNVPLCAAKLDSFWAAIAPRYKNRPNSVVFELLNEPHAAFTPELWNVQLRKTLAIVRASNPTRNVIIGPGGWNAMEQLATLDLPESDHHLIVTFHYYHPMMFTHQGVTWIGHLGSVSGRTWGTPGDYQLLNKEFDEVRTWAAKAHRPIFLGEFGTYEAAPMADRVRWTSAVARAAEARGFAWAYWQFYTNYCVFDVASDGWIFPIKNALIPPPR
jgi:endoglucanase